MDGKSKVPERTKPTLITIGDRQISSDGRYHDPIAFQWLEDNAANRFAKVGEFARAMFCNGTVQAKRKIRGRINRIRKYARDQHGQVLMVEYNGPFGAASAIKFYNPNCDEDRQLVDAIINRAVHVGDCKQQDAAALREAVATLNARAPAQLF